MGLESLLIRSDGIIYPNKKFLQDKEAKLIKLQVYMKTIYNKSFFFGVI